MSEVTLHTAKIESLADLQRLQAKCYGAESEWCPCLWSRAILFAQTLVAVDEEQEIVGYGVCEEGRVIGVAVWSPYRRGSVGRNILSHLEGSVTQVHESNLVGQQFLRSCGWKCNRIAGDRYEFVPLSAVEIADRDKPKRKPRAKKKAKK